MYRSRCGDLRAGSFRRVPLRGRLRTVELSVVFPSPLPPCRAPAIGVGSTGAMSLDFPPLFPVIISCLGKAFSVRVRVRDTGPQLRVTSALLLSPSFSVSHARPRNVFLCPPLLRICPSPHTPVPSHLTPCLVPNVSLFCLSRSPLSPSSSLLFCLLCVGLLLVYFHISIYL